MDLLLMLAMIINVILDRLSLLRISNSRWIFYDRLYLNLHFQLSYFVLSSVEYSHGSYQVQRMLRNLNMELTKEM